MQYSTEEKLKLLKRYFEDDKQKLKEYTDLFSEYEQCNEYLNANPQKLLYNQYQELVKKIGEIDVKVNQDFDITFKHNI